MLVGTSQIDITPKPGVELQGFAIREQPSTTIADPLFVRALFVQTEEESFLWLTCDILGMDVLQANHFRFAIAEKYRIPKERICLSTTHTHSGPGVAQLLRCGEYHAGYTKELLEKILIAVQKAMASMENCELYFGEADCAIGIDRHNGPEKHTDTRIPIVAWKKADGGDEFKAVLVSYSMHPVCLRGRAISADWPGEVSRIVSDTVPGNPVTLVLSGSCGNINPPEVGVSYEKMQKYAQTVADPILGVFRDSTRLTLKPSHLSVSSCHVALSKRAWSKEEIEQTVTSVLAQGDAYKEFNEIFLEVVQIWKRNMLNRIESGESTTQPVELYGVRFADIEFLMVSAEIFSHLTKLIATDHPNRYVIGCSNGIIGYIAVASSHDSGGYEADWASFFYNGCLLEKGGLERLAQSCRNLFL